MEGSKILEFQNGHELEFREGHYQCKPDCVTCIQGRESAGWNQQQIMRQWRRERFWKSVEFWMVVGGVGALIVYLICR